MAEPEARARWASTAAICLLAAGCEGIDLQAAGVAAPRLVPFLKLNPAQTGEFFSASTAGLLIGAPLGGWLADRFGRKMMLFFSILVFGAFALLTSRVNDLEGLIAMRFLTGLGLGGALPNMIALASESAPPARKGLAVGLMYGGMPLGGALAGLTTLTAGVDWRTVFYVGGLAPLLLAPVVVFGVRDSYRARQDLRESFGGILRALFGQGRALDTLLLWIAFGLTLLVLYLLLNWLPSLLISRGFSRSLAASVQIVFNLGGVVGSAAIGLLLDGARRVPVTVLSFVLSIGGLLLLASMAASGAGALAIGAGLGFAIMSNQALLYAMAPWCYPTEIRGAGVGAAVAVGRVGSLIGPLLAGQWVGAGASVSNVLFHLLPILSAGAGAAVALAFRARPMKH
jgi:AAHS family 3-hydroxyphenylpropionic acid transporter